MLGTLVDSYRMAAARIEWKARTEGGTTEGGLEEIAGNVRPNGFKNSLNKVLIGNSILAIGAFCVFGK